MEAMTRGAKFCDDLFTLQESAAQLGISTKTLHRMVIKGEVPVVMLHKSKRIRRQDLETCIITLPVPKHRRHK